MSAVGCYEQVLRTLTYEHTSEDPDPTPRSLTVVVSDGELWSEAAVSTITVEPVNDRPVVDLNGDDVGIDFAATFTEDGGPVAAVSATLSVTDVDSPHLSSATVTVTNLVDAGEEILAAETAGTSIVATYDGSSGVLSLAGSDTVAHYEQVLRTLTYEHTSQNPDAMPRFVEVVVSDGKLWSEAAVSTITVEPVNDSPVVDLNGDDVGIDFAATFTEDGGPVAAVSATLSVTDVDSPQLSSATVTVTNLLDAGEEILAVETAGTSIVATYDGSSGVLSLAGPDTVAHYEQVLRTLTYEHTSEAPGATPRLVEMVVSDGELSSEVAVSTITVEPVNDAPVVDLNGPEAPGTGFASTFTEGLGAVSIVGSTLSIRDLDSEALVSGTVTITNRRDDASEVLLVETGGTGISAAYEASQGVLTLSGAAPLSSYEDVLRTLRYENPSWDPDRETRRIEVVVSDGTADSEAAVSWVEVIASTHGIFGYVYVDVNNDGLKDASEIGLPNVPVRLEGPVSRVVLTDATGGYYFGDLPSGRYSVYETQPTAFMDGRETAGGPVACRIGDDVFYDLELSGPDTQAAGYNFGERGLRAELVTKQLFLSSSPSGEEMLRQLDVVGGNGWYPFVAAHDASVTVDLGPKIEEPSIEIYGAGWRPVMLSAGERTATAEVKEGESYVLYVSGSGLEIVNVCGRLDRSGIYTNPENALDVSGDGYVSPIDALLVIRTLNDRGSHLMYGPSEEPPYVDVSGDGYVSPIDALRIIDHLNEPDERPGGGLSESGEGESVASVSGESWSVAGERDAWWAGGVVTDPWLSVGLNEMDADHVGAARRPGRWRQVPVSGREIADDVLSVVARGVTWNGVRALRGEDGLATAEAWRAIYDDADGADPLLSSDIESLLNELAEDVAKEKGVGNLFLVYHNKGS